MTTAADKPHFKLDNGGANAYVVRGAEATIKQIVIAQEVLHHILYSEGRLSWPA